MIPFPEQDYFDDIEVKTYLILRFILYTHTVVNTKGFPNSLNLIMNFIIHCNKTITRYRLCACAFFISFLFPAMQYKLENAR